MNHTKMLGFLLLLLATAAEPARARPPLVLLLPAGDDPIAAANALAGVDLGQLARAQPQCDGATLPCSARARRGRTLWTAPTTPEGCELPLVILFARHRFKTQLSIGDDCSITVRRPERERPSLHFPPLLAFPDVDNEQPGIDYAPLVRSGFEIQRRRWVRAVTKKDGFRITRATAGLDYWERCPIGCARPFVDLVQFNNKVGSRFPEYPWQIAARNFLPSTPAPDGMIFTHTNTTTGTFTNNRQQSHLSIAQVFVGPNAFTRGACLIQGTVPVSSTVLCEHRFSVLTPARRML